MNIEITVHIDGKQRTYTIYPEELQQIVCNKAREDNPRAKCIEAANSYFKINTWSKGV